MPPARPLSPVEDIFLEESELEDSDGGDESFTEEEESESGSSTEEGVELQGWGFRRKAVGNLSTNVREMQLEVQHCNVVLVTIDVPPTAKFQLQRSP